MENIIIIAHGSRKKEANNNTKVIAQLLHSMIHPGCDKNCVKVGYMEIAKPSIIDAINSSVEDGTRKIILHPYLLSSGVHVTEDIPEIIEEAKNDYPDVEFVYTEPLGIHEKLAQVALERIMEAKSASPEFIQKRSFEIVSDEGKLSEIPSEQLPIVKRVIHATADFEFKETLKFHPDAIKTGINVIKAEKNILTDVEMVKAGINKRLLGKLGGKVVCHIADDDVFKLSEETGKTRSEIAIEKGLNDKVGIVAIGNAPTALLKTVELMNSSQYRDKVNELLVIGVPVGFVKALESKSLLATQDFPFITNLSRKGGSSVAVAIVNAVLNHNSKMEKCQQ